MIKISKQIIISLFWILIGVLISYLLNITLFNSVYYLYQQIANPSLFDFIRVIYLLILIAFSITFFIQRRVLFFSKYKKMASICLIIVIIYMIINLLGSIFLWDLPNWVTYVLRL